MFNFKSTIMNAKSLFMLFALAGLVAGCANDDLTESGGNAPAGTSEIQVSFSGSGESQDYSPTRAIASDSENRIDKLEVYLFAASQESGPYYWKPGTKEPLSTKHNPKTKTSRNKHPAPDGKQPSTPAN